MSLEVSLQVVLKGVDLVTETAYRTLADKLGYADKLLALLRLESYAFTIGCDDAANAVAALRRSLAVQSTFYNRNKHNYFLDCRWPEGQHTEGVDPLAMRRRLASEAGARLEDGTGNLDSHGLTGGVILEDVPEARRFPEVDTASHLYRSEVLVEDLEDTTRTTLAGRLESELAITPVTVSELGTRWILALRTGSEADAESLTREIVVTEKRDRGLLLNPNHQGYKIVSLGPLTVHTPRQPE
jgi:hypothetical protein